MVNEPSALSTISPTTPAETDYDVLCQTIMGTARGRWFLEEYARRNRHADTRLVLEAVGRLEGVIKTEQAHHAGREWRIGLLEMARAIAQTRADVAEIEPEAVRHREVAEPKTAATEVFAAAERLQDVAWTMRERGLDMAMCDQISDLSSAILSASALRDPNDGRARKLGEVLRYLEQRVDSMLDTADQGARPPVAEDVPNNRLAHSVNGHAVEDRLTAMGAEPPVAVEASERPVAAAPLAEPQPEPIMTAPEVAASAPMIEPPAAPPDEIQPEPVMTGPEVAASAPMIEPPAAPPDEIQPEPVMTAPEVAASAPMIEAPAAPLDEPQPEPAMTAPQVAAGDINPPIEPPMEAADYELPTAPIEAEPNLIEPESVAIHIPPASVALEQQPPAAAQAAPSTEEEPADFLLEPLPMPQPVGTTAAVEECARLNGHDRNNGHNGTTGHNGHDGHHGPASSAMPPWYVGELTPEATAARTDQLAALRAMSPEERLALFT